MEGTIVRRTTVDPSVTSNGPSIRIPPIRRTRWILLICCGKERSPFESSMTRTCSVSFPARLGLAACDRQDLNRGASPIRGAVRYLFAVESNHDYQTASDSVADAGSVPFLHVSQRC